MKKFLALFTTFLPWISFAALSSVYPSLSIPSAIFFSLFSWNKLLKGFILDWCSLLFFIAVWIDVRFLHHVWLLDHMSIIVSIFLVAVSVFSLLIRKPFTMQYAKLEVKKEQWHSYHFLRINQLMTAGLGIIFFLMGIIAVYQFLHPDFINQWVIFGAAFLTQILFIRLFPRWYQKRYLAR
jgi:hypothetical protein